MKKPFKYTEREPTKKCKKCGRPLKKNLLAKKPKADLCYPCFKKSIVVQKTE